MKFSQLVGEIDPEISMKARERAEAQQGDADQKRRTRLGAYLGMAPEQQALLYGDATGDMASVLGVDPAELPPRFSPELLPRLQMALGQAPAGPEKGVLVGGRLVRPTSGDVVYEPPPEAGKPSFSEFVGEDGRRITEVRWPDGRVEYREGPTVGATPSAQQPTGSIQEYNLYAQQETASGRKPISFDAWQQREANRRPNQPQFTEVFDPEKGVSTLVEKRPGLELPPPPTAQERNRSSSLNSITPILDGISELSEKINTGKGLMAKISGGVERARAEANYNDDVAEYEALISGFTPMVARAVGHTGVLTQQDVDSVRALFPRPGDSKSLRDRKIKRIKTVLGAQGMGDAPEVPSGTLDQALDRAFGASRNATETQH